MDTWRIFRDLLAATPNLLARTFRLPSAVIKAPLPSGSGRDTHLPAMPPSPILCWQQSPRRLKYIVSTPGAVRISDSRTGKCKKQR